MKTAKILIAVLCIVGLLAAAGCSGGGGGYADYAAAYQALAAGGGLDANFTLDLTMDGSVTHSTGNMKVANSDGGVKLLCQMNVGGQTVTQFSDGSYIYTDNGIAKTMYAIGAEPAGGDDTEQQVKTDGGEFNTDAFLSEFSGFLEAGKIKQLGLLDPIDERYVSSIDSATSGDATTYTLGFSDQLVQSFLNVLVADQVRSSENALTFSDLRDFSYTAVEQNGMITGLAYAGTTTVTVPGALMADGADASYDIGISLVITFNNPGSAVDVTLPDASEYVDIG